MKPSRTIVLLDWDDSLLPTSEHYHTKQNFDFRKVDLSISALISHLNKFENIEINILTSSTNNWVTRCIDTFKLNKTRKLIRNIPIIYVSDYIPDWTNINSIEHKLYVIYKLYYGVYKNFISIGDGGGELYAFKKMIINPDIVYKHISLIQTPTYKVLIKQHKHLINLLNNFFINYHKNLYVQFSS